MQKLVAVLGVNGVGKSSALKLVKERRPEIEVVHGRTLLKRRLQIETDRELREADHETAVAAWTETVAGIAAEYADKTVLVDTHMMNLKNGIITRYTGPWLRHFDALILLSDDAERIFDRITLDPRDRALFLWGTSVRERLDQFKKYVEVYEAQFRCMVREQIDDPASRVAVGIEISSADLTRAADSLLTVCDGLEKVGALP